MTLVPGRRFPRTDGRPVARRPIVDASHTLRLAARILDQQGSSLLARDLRRLKRWIEGERGESRVVWDGRGQKEDRRC